MKSLFLLFMARVLIKNGWVYSPAAVFQRRSVLILGDRIEAILPADEPTTASHADVEVIDVGGAHVLPGFVDTHIHLTTLALTRLRCDLSGVRSARELCDVLSTWASENDTPTVMGVGWDESGWQDSRYPTRAMLDAIDARRPLLARRICGHMGVANSPLLKRLTPQPDFIDGASGVVRELSLWEAGGLCEPDLDRLGVEIEVAIASLHRLGITGIHDIVEAAKLDHYLRGVNQSKAPLRIDVLLHTDCDRFKDHAARCSHMDRRVFRLAGIKLFLDGSLGGHSAALNMPYADHDGARGTLLMELDALRAILNACYRGGYMCAMHAIGDRAIDQALSGLADFPSDADNFRIEHCEIVGDEQLPVLASRPVFLSLQPNFVRQWGLPGGIYERRLGTKRLRSCNRFASLMNADVPFVFGSDGMPPGPLYGLKGAADHPIREERLRPADAIDRYTRWPSQVGGHKKEAGVLAAGQLADIVVLDGDPLRRDFLQLNVARTLVGGRTVFAAPKPRGAA